MPQGNLVEVLGREVRQGSPGELMVEGSPSRQRRPPCETNNEMSDEAATRPPLLTYLLFTIAQSGQGAVEHLPMHYGSTDGPHIHKWVSCSPPKFLQKHEHQSENMMGVDSGSCVLSGPVALPHEKPTVEDNWTPVLQKVQHSFTYHTLQSIHRCPTAIGNNL